MAGFGEALKKGLVAQQRAAEARREMDQVLAAASKEVAAILGARISLQFDIVNRPARGATDREAVLGIPAPHEKITALIAKRDTGASAILAEVTFSEVGYPVTLRWESRWDDAADSASFEELIKQLLAHGATAEKIAGTIAAK